MLRSAKTSRIASPALLPAAATLVSFLAAALVPGVAQAQDLVVKYDQATIVRLSRPATEIIIGNPTIADVAIQSGTSMVITGKSFGVTNIIALDAQGQVIRDQRVLVRLDDERMVQVHKGTQRQSFACSPNCAPTLTVGDEDAFFKKYQDTITAKTKMSEGGGSDHGGGN
jgi:Flp pilus assembly secretin CpaC